VALSQNGPIPYEELRTADFRYLSSLSDLIGRYVVIFREDIRGYFQGLVVNISLISLVARACDPEGLCILQCEGGRGVIITAKQTILIKR
jgi:hypothetical protein